MHDTDVGHPVEPDASCADGAVQVWLRCCAVVAGMLLCNAHIFSHELSNILGFQLSQAPEHGWVIYALGGCCHCYDIVKPAPVRNVNHSTGTYLPNLVRT